MHYTFPKDLELADLDSGPKPNSPRRPVSGEYDLRLIQDKIRIPSFENLLIRPRLIDLTTKSVSKLGAAMLVGRAGTGKTALAATLVKTYENVAWFSIDSSDSDWRVFFKYFVASFNEPLLVQNSHRRRDIELGHSTTAIAYLVEGFVARLAVIDTGKPRLIVLDNVHHIFDSDWFSDFFNSLIFSLPQNVHLVLLSRCQPPTPLWRLRSKQRLGVVEENLLAFNKMETNEFLRGFGLSPNEANRAFRKSFGRISRIREIAAARAAANLSVSE